MCRYGCVMLLFALCAVACAAQDAQSKADLEKLQGKWRAVSAILDGKDDPQLESWTVTQNKLTVHRDQDRTWTITLDATKQPKTMDLHMSDPPRHRKAIYQLEGDTVRFCIEMKDNRRPERFAARPGSGHRLVTLKRVQSSEDTEQLQKELDLLKKERELLKREQETLKKENTALKKGKGSKPEEEPKDVVLSVTIDKVEYVYAGSVRKDKAVIVNVLATSQDGNRPEPRGQMTLIDEDGEKYVGSRVAYDGPVQDLREGVAVKLQWQFGGGDTAGMKTPPGPPSKVKRFSAVIIDYPSIGRGAKTIEFRHVPFAVTKPK
jgi:uncharacterized protein (TIGR03067 family)